MSTPLYYLSSRHQGICTYGGFVGIMVALTCVIQLMVVGNDHWMIFAFLGGLLFAITGFLMLALQKAVAPIFLIVNSFSSFAIVLLVTWNHVFSLIMIVHFVYNTVLLSLLIVEGIPALLAQRGRALSADEAHWEGKL